MKMLDITTNILDIILQRTTKYIVWLLFIIGTCIPAISLAQLSDAESGFPYDIQGETYDPIAENPTTELASSIIAPDIIENDQSIFQRLTDYFRLSNTSYFDDTTSSPATNYIRWILNILLGLVSFLSLIMVIFAFYLIFFSKGDEAVAKARKILIGVGIALTIMGLSWFIASYFFDIYSTVTGSI